MAKNIDIYYIGHITIKIFGDCESIYSLNPLYLPVNHARGYIAEKSGNKYLLFDDSVNENKGLLKICRCLGWNLKRNQSNKWW